MTQVSGRAASGSVTQDLWGRLPMFRSCVNTQMIYLCLGPLSCIFWTGYRDYVQVTECWCCCSSQRLGGQTEWCRFDRSYEYRYALISDRPYWRTLRATGTEQMIWQGDIETCYCRGDGQRTGVVVGKCMCAMENCQSSNESKAFLILKAWTWAWDSIEPEIKALSKVISKIQITSIFIWMKI